jgi:hypothetical protein
MTTNCFVCYDNILTSPLLTSVTPTSQRTGFSAANCYDWYTTSYWSPAIGSAGFLLYATFSSAVTADYLAIYRHNLGSAGGAFYVDYSHDNWATYTSACFSTSATDNELKIILFTAITARYWRVVFSLTPATPFYVGVVMLGRKLPLYRGMIGGFVVPRHGRKNEIINQKTEGGQFVGRVKTSQGARSSINFKHVTQSWVRANWEAFVRHAELLPFLFSWNHDTYPQDAVYCVTDGEIPYIPINDNHHHDINLPVQCLLSGDAL